MRLQIPPIRLIYVGDTVTGPRFRSKHSVLLFWSLLLSSTGNSRFYSNSRVCDESSKSGHSSEEFLQRSLPLDRRRRGHRTATGTTKSIIDFKTPQDGLKDSAYPSERLLNEAIANQDASEALKIYLDIKKMQVNGAQNISQKTYRSLRRLLRSLYKSKKSVSNGHVDTKIEEIEKLDISTIAPCLDSDPKNLLLIVLCLIRDMESSSYRIGSSEVTDKIYCYLKLNQPKKALLHWKAGVERQDRYLECITPNSHNKVPQTESLNENLILGISAHNFAIAAAVDTGDGKVITDVFHKAIKCCWLTSLKYPSSKIPIVLPNMYTFHYYLSSPKSSAMANYKKLMMMETRLLEFITQNVDKNTSASVRYLIYKAHIKALVKEGNLVKLKELASSILYNNELELELRSKVVCLILLELRSRRMFGYIVSLFRSTMQSKSLRYRKDIWNTYLLCLVSKTLLSRHSYTSITTPSHPSQVSKSEFKAEMSDSIRELFNMLYQQNNTMPWIQIKVIALCGMIKCKEYVEAVDFYSKNPEMETNTVAVDAIIRLLADQDFLENLRNCEEVFAVPWRVFIKIICSSERNRGFAIDNRLVHTVYLIMSSKFACQDSEYFSPDVFNSALEWLGKNLRSEDFYSLTRNIHISLKLGYLDRALQYYNAIISNDGHGENRNLFAINRLLISSLATNDINTKNISSTLGSNIPTLDSFPTSHEFITKNVPPSQYDMAYLTLAKILINATNDPNVRLYSIMNFIRTMRNTKSGFHRNVPPRALYNMAFSLILETKKFAEADIIHRWLIDDEHKRLHRKPFSRNTKMLIEKILKH